MSGPAPQGNDAKTQTQTTADPAQRQPADTRAQVPPTAGLGVVKARRVMTLPVPPQDQLAQILIEHPQDIESIMQLLHGDPRIGNLGVQQIIMLADSSGGGIDWKRYELASYGTNPGDKSYLKTAHVAEGGGAIADVKTSDREAAALNEIRRREIRLKPAFVRALQHALGIANASGAMNTDTLRALLKQPQLDGVKAIKTNADAAVAAADIITQDAGQWLEALVPVADRQAALDAETETSADRADPSKQKHATAFTATTATHDAWNPAKPAAQRLAVTDTSWQNGHRADRVAKALGYDAYTDYKGGWTDIDFLGGNFGAWPKVHPAVNERLAVAAAWLRQRHPSKTDAQVRKEIKWSGSGAGGYGATEEYISGDKAASFVPGVHMHSFGLAFDIDVGSNPYVFAGASGGGFWNKNMAEHLRRAAQLYGGEALSAEKLDTWSKTMSTEELFAKVERASESLHKYLAEPKGIAVTDPAMQQRAPTAAEKTTVRTGGKEVDSPERTAYKKEMHDHQNAADAVRIPALASKFTAIGYAPDEANKAASEWLDFTLAYHGDLDGAVWDAVGRAGSTNLTTHTQDLVIALRDVAGFAWGGTEMSASENGDFMHFDLRNTKYGKTVLDAAGAQEKATDSVTDKKKAADQRAEAAHAAQAAKEAPK